MILNLCKGNSDAFEHGNCRGLKLLNQIMEVAEKTWENMAMEKVRRCSAVLFCFK